MRAKNRTFRLLFPIVVIAIGATFIVTKKGSSGYGEPEVESPWVVVVGVLLCLLGLRTFIRSIQEIRAEEKVPSSATLQSYYDAAHLIEAFVEDRTAEWEWDDFMTVEKGDAFLENVRVRCLRVCTDHPSHERQKYCSVEGITILRGMAKELKDRAASVRSRLGP